jgi:PAS domain S-box-containing protein
MSLRLRVAALVGAAALAAGGGVAILAYPSAVDPGLCMAPMEGAAVAQQTVQHLTNPDQGALEALRQRLALATLAIGLLGALLGWYAGGRLARRLEALSVAMTGFGRGNAAPPPGAATPGATELDRLDGAFQAMVEYCSQTQAALQRSEQRFALAQRAGGIGTWEWDIPSGRVYWSEPILEMFGLRPGEFGGTYDDYMARVHPEDRAAVAAGIQGNLDAGGRYEVEHRIVRPDGGVGWVAACGELRRNEAGEPRALLGVVRDVTASREAEAALRASEARLAEAQALAHLGSWELDLTSGVLHWSEEIYRIFGVDPQRFGASYESFIALVHPEDRALVSSAYQASVADRKPYAVEHRLLLRDGRIKYVREMGRTYYDQEGRPLRSIGTVQDITAHQLAEQALRASEAQLAEAQAIAGLGSWELDLDTGRAHWSAEEYRLLGYPPHGVEPSVESFLKVVHPQDLEAVQEEMQAAARRPDGAYVIEHRVGLPDGSERTLLERGLVQCDAQGRPVRMVGTTLDVTQLRCIQRALREAELRLHSVVTSAPIVLFSLDRAGVFTVSEGQGLVPLGLKPGEAVGQSALSMYADYPEVVADLRRALAGERVAALSHVGGRVYAVRYTPVLNRQGVPDGLIGLALDDTERWQAHQELARHRDHLEELVAERTARLAEQARIIDEIHDAVVTTDLDGVITSWNLGAERLFGYRSEEVLGRSVALLHLNEEILREQITLPLLAAGRHELEVSLRRKDGSDLVGHLSLALRRGPTGEPAGMIGYTVDISERKRVERVLERRTRELEAAYRELESFSYSVSHDLRGPLRAVDGFSQALSEDYGDSLDGTAAHYLQRIRGGAQRMGQLIDDLLQLSRVTRSELRIEPVDLSAIAAEQTELLCAASPERRVEVTITPGLTARGDGRLLRTLLQNLLENAWKFTGRRPLARIEVGCTTTPEGEAWFVADNGAGFDMRYADKLFGPFQRLHRMDEFEGTGIGLATVQRIINRHGGRVWAQARVDEGATFYFRLPQNEQAPAEPSAREPEPVQRGAVE